MHWALNYWRAQKASACLPEKRFIDVTDFPPRLLPMLFLLERIEADQDYVVRLAGTAYRDIYQREITGLAVNRLLPHSDAGANLRVDLDRALAREEPIFVDGLLTWPPSGAKVTYQRLLLPYRGDHGSETRFFLGVARITDPKVALRT